MRKYLPGSSFKKNSLYTIAHPRLPVSIYPNYRRSSLTTIHQKLNWDLTNGPLRKLLELLDTQVFRGPFSGSCWRFFGRLNYLPWDKTNKTGKAPQNLLRLASLNNKCPKLGSSSAYFSGLKMLFKFSGGIAHEKNVSLHILWLNCVLSMWSEPETKALWGRVFCMDSSSNYKSHTTNSGSSMIWCSKLPRGFCLDSCRTKIDATWVSLSDPCSPSKNGFMEPHFFCVSFRWLDPPLHHPLTYGDWICRATGTKERVR